MGDINVAPRKVHLNNQNPQKALFIFGSKLIQIMNLQKSNIQTTRAMGR